MALRRGSAQLWLGAYGLLGLAAAKGLAFDGTLGDRQYGVSLLVLAGAAVAAALLEQARGRADLGPLAPGLALVASLLAGAGALTVVEGGQADGLALLVAAAAFGALATAFVRRAEARDLATALWTGALALGLGASVHLLANTWLVVAWAATCAALALAGARLREPRLQLAALAFGALAVAETIVELARPDELFHANADPAGGLPALVASIAALVVLVLLAHVRRDPADELDDRVVAEQARGRQLAIGLAAGLALYAASLGVLGLSLELGGADLASEFQRGHTAVSALWGLVGLVLLTVGLSRGRRAPRRAGVLLFGVALVKLFTYDLSTLSSLARALSFLAVGGVLLLAGFFYQRLAAELDDRNGQPA